MLAQCCTSKWYVQPDVSIDVSMCTNTTLPLFSNDRSSMLCAATIVSPMDIEEQLDDEQSSMSISKSSAVYDSGRPPGMRPDFRDIVPLVRRAPESERERICMRDMACQAS